MIGSLSVLSLLNWLLQHSYFFYHYHTVSNWFLRFITLRITISGVMKLGSWLGEELTRPVHLLCIRKPGVVSAGIRVCPRQAGFRTLASVLSRSEPGPE